MDHPYPSATHPGQRMYESYFTCVPESRNTARTAAGTTQDSSTAGQILDVERSNAGLRAFRLVPVGHVSARLWRNRNLNLVLCLLIAHPQRRHLSGWAHSSPRKPIRHSHLSSLRMGCGTSTEKGSLPASDDAWFARHEEDGGFSARRSRSTTSTTSWTKPKVPSKLVAKSSSFEHSGSTSDSASR